MDYIDAVHGINTAEFGLKVYLCHINKVTITIFDFVSLMINLELYH